MAFEEQNFTFKKGQIFPIDWLQTRPYSFPDAVDRYYVDLANRISHIIETSPMASSFNDREHILRSAILIAEWFEDICSETGIWHAVNKECQKRYGVLLPFYDLSDYYSGEVNLQDLRLLIWDILQRAHIDEGRIINPENPGIYVLAGNLFETLENEYETAPANERLHAFIHDGEVGKDLWRMRDWMNWFTFRSYVNFSAQKCLLDEIGEELSGETSPELLYGMHALHSFTHRRNLLSLSAPKWASRILDDPSFESMELIDTRPYRFLQWSSDGVLVEDVFEGGQRLIDGYSLHKSQTRKYLQKEGPGCVLICSLLSWKNTYSLCGSLSIMERSDGNQKSWLEEEREQHRIVSSQHLVYEDFLRASGGRDILFMKDSDQMLQYFTENLAYSVKAGIEMPASMRGKKDIIMFADPVRGIESVPEMARCVKLNDNPYYKKTYAEKNSLSVFCNDEAMSYRLSCRLRDQNAVPDAYMNSILGKKHGRDFLHANGDFMADYYFACSRQYDFDPYYQE